MSHEGTCQPRGTTIDAPTAAARWAQALSLFETFVEIWGANPQLARQAGRRVEELMLPSDEVRRRHIHDLT